MLTTLWFDAGADVVALTRIQTSEAVKKSFARVKGTVVTDIQLSPLFRLNSIALDTPVIESLEPL